MWLVTIGLFYYQHGDIKWLFGAILSFLTPFVLYYTLILKKVELDESFLYVSKFFKKYKIPLEHVKDVRQNIHIWHSRIIIELKHSTPVGDTIQFIPKFPPEWGPFDLTKYYKEYPIVKKLINMSRKDPGSGLD